MTISTFSQIATATKWIALVGGGACIGGGMLGYKISNSFEKRFGGSEKKNDNLSQVSLSWVAYLGKLFSATFVLSGGILLSTTICLPLIKEAALKIGTLTIQIFQSIR